MVASYVAIYVTRNFSITQYIKLIAIYIHSYYRLLD